MVDMSGALLLCQRYVHTYSCCVTGVLAQCGNMLRSKFHPQSACTAVVRSSPSLSPGSLWGSRGGWYSESHYANRRNTTTSGAPERTVPHKLQEHFMANSPMMIHPWLGLWPTQESVSPGRNVPPFPAEQEGEMTGVHT